MLDLDDVIEEAFHLSNGDSRARRVQEIADIVRDEVTGEPRPAKLRALAVLLCEIAHDREDVGQLAARASLLSWRLGASRPSRRAARPMTAWGVNFAKMWAKFTPAERRRFRASIGVKAQTINDRWLKGSTPRLAVRRRIEAVYGLRAELADLEPTAA